MASMTSPGRPDRRLTLDLIGDSVHRVTRTIPVSVSWVVSSTKLLPRYLRVVLAGSFGPSSQ